jgi:hypothetical protein
MRRPKALGICISIITLMMIVSACNQPYSQNPSSTNTPNSALTATEPPAVTELPAATEPPATEFPSVLTAIPEPPSLEEQLAQIDASLRQALSASIAYNIPVEMQVNETVTIELLLNPSLSEEELKEQISERGGVHTSADVQITPQMKAEIISPDEDAFSIRPLHDDPVQLISGTETTKWSWYVTAQKAGPQILTIVVRRLVKFDNEEYWREVNAYKEDVNVQITLLNRLRAVDWKWIAGLLITLAVIPALRRWYDQRKNQPEPTERSRKKTGLSGLPGNSKTGSPRNEHLGNIFISYRRSDSADIAGRIYDRLVDEFGRDSIFKDVDSIPLGTDFKEYLDRKVSECNVLLAIIGDRWVDARDTAGKKRLEDPSDFIRVEIGSALERGITVIPILVRGAQMPVEEDLPLSLRKLVYKNGIQIRPDPDFHRDMDRLIAALNKYIRYWRRA